MRADRRTGALEAIQLDFDLPVGWEAVRLADLAWPQAGFAFKSSSFNTTGHGLPLIRIRDVGANSPTTYYSGEFREEFIVRQGDWLIGMDGDFRVARWTGPDALLNQRVTRLVFLGDEIQQLYVSLALQQELRKLQGAKAYTTVDHLSGGQIASRIILLPPLAEQHRIVARVEELMKLCDALEQSGRLADEQHGRLTATLFDALAASESAQALADNWQRVAEHFDLLLDRPEAVDALEQGILNVAVRGALVPQSEAEEAAEKLLERAAVEIAGYRTENGLQPLITEAVSQSQRPFAPPPGWVWVRLESICKVITDGDHQAPPKSDGGVAFLTIGNITSGVIEFDQCRYVPPDYWDRIAAYRRPERGDILYTVVGATYGRPACVDTDRRFCVQRHIAILKPSGLVSRPYLHTLMQTPFVYSQATSSVTGTAQPTIPLRPLRNFLVPIPPLAEQQRIVARVEQLRRLCADLRQRLTQAREVQSRLADALVAELT